MKKACAMLTRQRKCIYHSSAGVCISCAWILTHRPSGAEHLQQQPCLPEESEVVGRMYSSPRLGPWHDVQCSANAQDKAGTYNQAAASTACFEFL